MVLVCRVVVIYRKTYFSCKTYQELARARITKVVVFFTSNPTKLGLHFSEFSTIFYAIYKILQNSNTI
jgi:hypothetical protein